MQLVNVSGDYTTTLDINYDTVAGALYGSATYLITGQFLPVTGPAIHVLPTTSAVNLVFKDGGSIHGFSENAITAEANISVTIGTDSTLSAHMQAIWTTGSLNLVNKGFITVVSDYTRGGAAINSAADATIINYGEIDGDGWLAIHANVLNLTNFGVIGGPVVTSSTTETSYVDNYGTMTAGLSLAGDGIVNNHGLIIGGVGGSAVYLVNTGTIGTPHASEAVRMATGAVNNFGKIFNGITFSIAGTFVNETGGVINGNVFGGTGRDFLIGNSSNESFVGRDGNDFLTGNAGDDRLDGGSGNDNLKGGLGDDTYTVDAAGDIITELDGQGQDTVLAHADYTLAAGVAVEILTAQAFPAGVGFVLTGNEFAQTITGRGGADTLDGGRGADTLIGLAGDDTYIVDNSADAVSEAVGSGIDTVIASVNFSLNTQTGDIENLTLVGGALIGTGNGLANTITGNNLANTLSGLGGADTLIGGLGKDTLTGGLHNDTFRFTLKMHSAASHTLADVIADFDDQGDDRIDLSGVYGPKLSFIGAAAFTKVGQVRINDIAGADVVVEVNTGGSLATDFSIRLKATTLASMTVGDFVL